MRKTTGLILLPIILCTLTACVNQADVTGVYFGQGTLSGEITEASAILQTRLTSSDTLVQGDLPGIEGMGYFEISQSSDFTDVKTTELLLASAENDHILKTQIGALLPGTNYFFRSRFARGTKDEVSKVQLKSFGVGPAGTFKTLGGAYAREAVSMVVVTGMNYYHFHYGKYKFADAYAGTDKSLGYPALETILQLEPQYFIGTGDNVYYDHPSPNQFKKAMAAGNEPHPGGHDGDVVVDLTGMRKKFHEQFSQPRFINLFMQVGTYWMKDDHDYRFNDSDPYSDMPISHELGIATFKEQLPFPTQIPYRTLRPSRDLQLWFLEGRDFRSKNALPDGPEKTIWGSEQKAWLQETLMSSDATFKLIISPTPMVGPDDAYKSDNHVNPKGFRHEGNEFFSWLSENDFLNKNLFFVCGDRHWQYHAQHPNGFEEFSTGALVDNNSRAGRLAGDPKSTDPDADIQQFYIQGTPEQATGGFLHISVKSDKNVPEARFRFFDEKGTLLYQSIKSTLRDE